MASSKVLLSGPPLAQNLALCGPPRARRSRAYAHNPRTHRPTSSRTRYASLAHHAPSKVLLYAPPRANNPTLIGPRVLEQGMPLWPTMFTSKLRLSGPPRAEQFKPHRPTTRCERPRTGRAISGSVAQQSDTLRPTSSRARLHSVAHPRREAVLGEPAELSPTIRPTTAISRSNALDHSAVILGDALVSLAHFWTTTVSLGFSSVGASKSPLVRARSVLSASSSCTMRACSLRESPPRRSRSETAWNERVVVPLPLETASHILTELVPLPGERRLLGRGGDLLRVRNQHVCLLLLNLDALNGDGNVARLEA